MTQNTKPEIIVLSDDSDTESFKWMSSGWNSIDNQTPESERLMVLANECIAAGKDVNDVINLLTKAGFLIRKAD